jgi:hypothetical protein
MVSNQRQPSLAPDEVETTLGISAVTDDVAEAEHLVDVLTILSDGFQGVPVCVYVRKDTDPQAVGPYTLG